MAVVLPILYGITIGGQEIYGIVDAEGQFQEREPSKARRSSVLPLAGDLGLELPCNAEIVGDDGTTIAVVHIGVLDRRIACTGISAIEGQELTGQVLRRVPLSKLVREASKSKIVYIRDGFAVHLVGIQHDPLSPRRRVLDDQFLQSVSHVYRAALLTGNSPGMAVAHQLGPTTPENARRWIMLARKEGFLGPSLGIGKKGEG